MSHLKLSNWLFVVAGLIGFNSAHAQTVEKLNEYKAKYPGNNVVQTANTEKVSITMVKNVPVLTYSYSNDYLALDKNGVHILTEESIGFTSFETVDNIEAYSLVPNGKSSKKIAATNFQTKDAETEGSVFHDDSKETSFLYPGIVEGALRHLSYDEKVTMTSFPIGFFMFSAIPCENPTFIVETDTAIHMRIQTYNLDKVNVTYTEKIEKGKRIMTWTAPTSYLIKDDEFAPNPRYYAPQILGQIAYYTVKKERVNVIGTVEDLHNDYQKNVAEVENETPSKVLASIADSLTRNIPDEFEKVKAVYYWVQDNVKYIAFEEGMGGFVPRQPSSVIDKRYGDCKDMASLIYSMLKSVGITSYITWIGSRDLPYKYSDFPSTFCDNHMIATYKKDGKNYYLDATNSFQSIQSPTGFIQGKEALVHLGQGKFEVAQVPVVPAVKNQYIDSSFVKLEDNKLVGRSSINGLGYYNTLFGNAFKEVGVKDYKNYYTRIFERGNNTFNVSNPRVVNQKNREGAVTMDFDWNIQNYSTKLDNEVFINLILAKEFVAFGNLTDKRDAPFEYDYEFDDNYIVCLEVPAGYTVKSIPKNVDYKSDKVDFSVTYTQEGNKIWCKTHFQSNFLMLYPSQFEEWNKFIAQKKAAMSETLVLIKK